MLSIQFQLMILYLSIQRALAKHVIDVEMERKDLDSVGKMFSAPKGVTAQKVSAGGVPGEWLEPRGALPERAVLYLHGGSYICGSVNSHRSLAGHIAVAAGARVLIIDYRMAPEHPHPAAVEDALAAYTYILKDGFQAGHVAVAGDSAGGGLTLALLLALRDGRGPLPGAAACLSPWTDLAFTGQSWKTKAKADLMIHDYKEQAFAKMYLRGADARTPLASPLYADLKGLPPLLVQVGTDEVLLSDSTDFAEKARAAGVDVTIEVWEHMQHVWQFAAGFIPESTRAVKGIGEFIRRHA
jgi:phosphinothricin tripeptide acetyl hydrolase